MGPTDSLLAISFREIPKQMTSMSNTKDMSEKKIEKKVFAITFTGSNEAQYIKEG